MGYDLHITRASFWYESLENPISRTEWENVARQHPLLAEDHVVTWKSVGEQPVFNVKGNSEEVDGTFSWYKGAITITNAVSDRSLEIAIELAGLLRAKVLGDEGERYLSGGRIERD